MAGMPTIVFTQVAASNVATYRETDTPLWEQFELVLEAIEAGDARAFETALRSSQGTAYSVEVTVYGRDDVYQVIWAKAPETGAVTIVHLGKALQA